MRAERVLIVEDNYDNRMIYSEILRHAGYEVLEAENGQEGVAMARMHAPDLVLMDLSMPVLDGWGAVAALKSDPETRAIPVLALSAHVVLNGDYAKARAAGFSAYLTKPIEPKDVLREVAEWLRRAPAGAPPPPVPDPDPAVGASAPALS